MTDPDHDRHQHDLVVIGAGSGDAILDAVPGMDAAIVEHGKFGGTCLNVGCIPTKMLAYTADLAARIGEASTFGLGARLDAVDWPGIRDRVFGRLDEVSGQGRRHRLTESGVTVHSGHAHFTGERMLTVERSDGSRSTVVTADRFVVAAGSRPSVPEPIASCGLPFQTSDTIMHLERLPARLAVLGGGYIAAEFAHVFSALGTDVTIIDMADSLLATQDESVAQRFTELARTRHDVRLGRQVTAVDGTPGALHLTLDDGSTVDADTLLVAIGRTPNGDRLNLEAAGIRTHDDGRIIVDGRQRTTAEGVFALGDISTSVPLKHVANREAQVVAHNLAHPDDMIETDLDVVPAAIFADPQIAAVGRTQAQCRDDGIDHVVGTHDYSDTAYGWAMEATHGFCTVIAERGTGRLLGAHILGAQASTLIQPLVLAMTCGIDAGTLARRPFWIHPALTEVVESALLDLDF